MTEAGTTGLGEPEQAFHSELEREDEKQTRLIFQISFLLEVVSGVPSHPLFLTEKPLDL